MYAGGKAVPTMAVAPIVAVAPAVLPDSAAAYLLDSGDRLRIVVFGQDGLSNTYVVDAAGNITMPLIGAVPARGSSTAELARQVGARLRNGFIREPHVAIEIESYRPFFILGEVTYPGQYPFVPNMTVETAVAIAGGFTPRAYRWDVKVARNQDGQAYRLAVPLTYALRPGDTITIEERWF
jgi:polysaccharide biosynthesis/export protein